MSAHSYLRTRPYPLDKVDKLNSYVELLSKFRYFLLTDISGVPAPALHDMRRKLMERGTVVTVIKNKVFLKALAMSRRRALDVLASKLTGQNAAIFTNENPFLLILFLRRYKMTRQARPGDIATSDIVVPAGNTGIAPGPAMSLFGKLKIPTRVTEGTIWVTSDTVVAKRGEVVTPELAELLGKLNIKPIEIAISIKVVGIDGRVVKPGEIELEPEYYSKLLVDAQIKAVNLALNAQLPMPEVAPLLVARASAEAEALAVALALPLPGVIERSVAKAHAEATVLYNLIKQRSPAF